jgi:hypothetical protein
MPPINNINILGHLKMASANLKLPNSKWKQPAGSHPSKAYGTSMSIAEKIAIPKTIPPVFSTADSQKHHQKSADSIGQDFKDFHDKMLDAVKYAHTMWKLQVKMKDLKVNSMTVLGTPGCLDGPELESNIKNAPMVASMTGNMQKHRDAVAKGVSKCFKEWQDKVMVPGLPWFPAFVAFPGPMAPPMPNVPMPLIACPSAMMSKIIAPTDMSSAMGDALDSGLKDKDPDKQYKALHDGLATVLSLSFLMWMPQQQVMLCMGKGPIPSFAPPYVPVGPVVMGDNIAAPGHTMT